MGSRATCTCVTIATIIIGACLKLDAKLNVIPRDSVVLINDSTYMNCSTSLEATDVQWFHGKNYVYAGRVILEPYNERFSVDINASTGACNLIIFSVQPSDAGLYECADDEGSGDRRSVQLIVLDAHPTCKSNIQSEGIIGPNSCDIEPDVVQLSCGLTYHGNVHPIFQWIRGENNQTIPNGLFRSAFNGNEVTNKLTMNSTLDLNNASFICEAAWTWERKYSCSSNISRIMYAFSSEVSFNITTDDEVSCSANSSQSCSYKWKWFSGDDISTESDNQILKPKRAGWHRCESTCSFGKKSCTVVSMHVNVSNNMKADAVVGTSGQSLLALLVLFVLLVVVLLIVIVIYRKRQHGKLKNADAEDVKKEQQRMFEFEKRKNANSTEEEKQRQRLLDALPDKYKRDPSLIGIITPQPAEEGNKRIHGITILNSELFVVYKCCREVEVYDSKFCLHRRWNLQEIANPEDIVSCKGNQCLYINGYTDENKPSKILKLDPNGEVMHRWETGDNWGWDLSVTEEYNVILTVHTKNKLIEYSPLGREVRVIRLKSAIRNPCHAIKWTNDHYIVSHSDAREVLERLCIVNADGNIEDSTDGKIGFTDYVKMNVPAHFAVDENGFVMVADKGNGRILLLNSDLEYLGVLISNEKTRELRFPVNIFLDKSNDRLFVADHKSGHDGRILIFAFCAEDKRESVA